MRELILSEKKWCRLSRHLFFWLFWGGYFTMVRYLNPMIFMTTGKFPDFFKSIAEGFFFLFPQIFLVYPLLYFVLPNYVFKNKYIKGILWLLFFFFVSMLIHSIILIYIPWDKVPWISTAKLFLTTQTFQQKFLMAYLASLQGAITGAALAASFKMFKYYYLKNQKNLQLQKENSDTQLQLLTAQIHPHFMFNTLNNIYSQAQEESPKSAQMILELSNILRYILDEGKKDWVRIGDDIRIVVDYLNLEKIRYDQKLDLHYSFPKNITNITIAPLLLLPLVENCFKHGASKIIDKPWINIKCKLKDQHFTIKLKNGKKNNTETINHRKSTGIENVRRRLELLYPKRHNLEIKEQAETFIINLSIELYPNNTTNQEIKDYTAVYESF